jgi:hypothetical protein
LNFFPRDQKTSAVFQGGPSLGMDNDPFPMVKRLIQIRIQFSIFTSDIFSS